MKTPSVEVFEWHRPMGGFQWENARAFPRAGEPPSGEGRYLVEQPMKEPLHEHYYPLLAYPTLYETFARLQPTEEDFLGFANTYGKLGGGAPLAPLPGQSRPIMFAERFDQWRRAHWKIGSVIDEVVAIRDRDIPTLRQWFEVTSEFVSYARNYTNGAFSGTHLAMKQHKIGLWLLDWVLAADSEDESILRAARGWAQQAINKEMGGADTQEPAAMVNARVLFDMDAKEMSIRVVPKNLYAAMWLQCANTVTAEVTLKVCARCGKTFDVATGKRRKQSLYCSPACKMAAYRSRKAAV